MQWSCTLGIFGALAMAYGFEPGATGKTATKSKSAIVTNKAKVPARATSGARRARTKGRAARKAAGPSYQQHPDPERYAEIQKALADRGYFHGKANGEWKDDSVDALKRFQTDQKLPDDGRIGALTLTGLGLGPHHDGSTAATVPLATAPVSEGPVSGSTVGPASSTVPKRDQP